MNKNTKISLGIVVLVGIVIVSVYFIFLAPGSVSVRVELPSGLKENPKLIVKSSKEQIEIDQTINLVTLKVKRSGDTVSLDTTNGKILKTIETGKDSKEIAFTFDQPSIEDFAYTLDKESGTLTLSWTTKSNSYDTKQVTLKRNGLPVQLNGSSYSESFTEFQGMNLLYSLSIEYFSEPFSINESKNLEIPIPQLPVEIAGYVVPLKPLDSKLVSISLDHSASSIMSDEFAFDDLKIGEHVIEVIYDGVPVITRNLNLQWKETPYEFAFYLYPLIIKNQELETSGDKLRLSWDCDYNSNAKEDVSFIVKKNGEEYISKDSFYIFDLPEDDLIISITPIYKGIRYGEIIPVAVEGSPNIEIEKIPDFLTARQLDLSFITENIPLLYLYLDNKEINSFHELEDEAKIRLESLAEGQHSLVFKGTGYYEQTFEKTFEFIVDTVPPNEPGVKSVLPAGDGMVIEFELPSAIDFMGYTVDLKNGETISGTTTDNKLFISPVSKDFKGTFSVSSYAKDFAGNESGCFEKELSVADFDKLFEHVTAIIEPLSSGMLKIIVENDIQNSWALLKLQLFSLSENREFEYSLEKSGRIEEIVEGSFFGEVSLRAVIKIAGAVSDSRILAQNTFEIGSLNNLKVYQIDESGAYRVEFENPNYPEISYEICSREEVKFISSGDFPDGKIIADFESPFSSETSEAIKIDIEIIAIAGNYREIFFYKDFSVFNGATILTGKISSEKVSIVDNGFPILIAKNLEISDDASLEIKGNGSIIFQNGASMALKGKLIIDSTDIIEIIGSTDSKIILEKGFFRGNNIVFTGSDFVVNAANSEIHLSNVKFCGIKYPFSLKDNSSLFIENADFDSAETAIYIDSPEEVRLYDLTIENSINGIIIDNNRGKINIENVEIKSDSSITGIRVDGNYKGTLKILNSNISSANNGIEIMHLVDPLIEKTTLNGSKSALTIRDCLNTLITDISITGDYLNGNPGTGIFISNSSAEISGSTISFCNNYGIYIANIELPEIDSIERANSQNPVLLRDLHFKNNIAYDIFITGSYNVTAPGMKIDNIKTYDARISEYWADGSINKLRGIIMVQ